jgi:chromosome segregation ATPase
VIGKFNSLVDRYNKLDSERQRLADQIAGLSADPRQPELDFNQAREDRGATAKSPSIAAPTVPDGAQDPETDPAEVETLRSQVAGFETKLQRKTAQLQAKDNQISNLRERLSRAHDNLEGQRKGKTQTV